MSVQSNNMFSSPDEAKRKNYLVPLEELIFKLQSCAEELSSLEFVYEKSLSLNAYQKLEEVKIMVNRLSTDIINSK